MNLYNNIFKRKSIRKYDMTPLPNQTLKEIENFAENLIPLYGDIKIGYEMVSHVKNIMPVKAPHYLIISSENKKGYLMNVGFMFQQMDLFLADKGLGSCWLGMAKPEEKMETDLEFVIILCFGKAMESSYRELSEFKRKSLSEISSGQDDRLECARLAPSAVNSQNWFFVADEGKIHIYQKKLNPVKRLIYHKMNQVDIGIAACHLYVATEHHGQNPIMTEDKGAIELKGYTYILTVA
ncbi:MAG: nitroreductase family protein [Acetobacterium sp.]